MKFYFLLVIGLLGCGSNATNADESPKNAQGILEHDSGANNDRKTEVLNGLYCANVYAENPNTGRKSNYTLEVVVENNYLVNILFTAGHLDTSHFEAPLLDDKHQCALTTDRGYNYRIEILDSNVQCEKQEAREVQCSGITKSGARCKRHTSHPSGMCFQHR